MFLIRLFKRKAEDDQSLRRNVRQVPYTDDRAIDGDSLRKLPENNLPPSSITELRQEGSSFNSQIHATYGSTVRLGNDFHIHNHAHQKQIIRAKPEDWLERLRFGHMERRRVQLEDDLPTPGTCQWLFEDEEFCRWENSSASMGNSLPILVLKGKPGSGKSVLCYSALDRYETLPKVSSNNLLTLGFFFNARNETLLEQNSEGFFRSLISQLLEKLPRESSDYSILRKFTLPEEGELDVDILRKVLLGLLLATQKRRIIIFLDAVDECQGYGKNDTTQIDHVLKFLHDISTSDMDVRVCLTTRNETNIRRRLHSFHLIDIKAHNAPDIESYINAELTKIDEIQPDLRHRLLAVLSRRCSNMFLWAKLILEQIEKQARFSPEDNDILKRVETTPTDLHKLYKGRLEDLPTESRAQALVLFQFVQVAVRPPTVPELQSVLASASASVDPDSSSSSKRWVELPTESFGHRLYNLSGGLIEITVSLEPHSRQLIEHLDSPPTCQFIHKTVKDFLDQGGLGFLDPTLNIGPDCAAHSHQQIASLCMQVMDTPDAADLAASRNREGFRTAFLRYACQFWTLHARKSNNITIEKFEPPTNLTLCQPGLIFGLFRKFQTPEVFAYSADIPNHNLLKCRFDGAICSRSPNAQYCQDSLLVLLAFEGCTKLFSRHASRCKHGEKCHNNQHILERAFFCSIHRGWIDTVRSVWDLAHERKIKIDLNNHSNSQRPFTPLYIACFKGKTDVVDFLLQKGADPLAGSNGGYFLPLHAAAAQGHLGVVQRLLESSACEVEQMLSGMINTKSERGGTPLHLATDFGRSAVVGEILRHYQIHDIGYLINAKFGMTRSPIELVEANMRNPELSMVQRRANFETIAHKLKEFASDLGQE